MKFSLLSLISCSLLALAGMSSADLGPGQKAPPIKVSHWIKGEPVEKFEEGRIYVVEFWATWCGPCRTSIPHLTKLAAQYKDKVTVIGVSVWEQEGPDRLKTVQEFVKSMGEEMNYVVALDTDENTMAETWMRAAFQNGIPAAFVVDGKGQIVWVGHPMAMDEPLAQIVKGEFDLDAHKEEFAAATEEAKREMALYQDLEKSQKLAKEGKKDEALAVLDAIKSEDPIVASQVRLARHVVYAFTDEAEAIRQLEELAKGDEAENLPFLAMTFAMEEAPRPLVVKAVDLTLAREKAGPFDFYLCAMALEKIEDKKRALEVANRALAEARKDSTFPPQLTSAIEALIEKLKKES